jgi:hypothetical protein
MMLLLWILACGGPTIKDPDTSEPDPGPCESGLCDVGIAHAEYTCDGTDTGLGPILSAELVGGDLAVRHDNVGPGCCPTLEVSAIANHRRGQLEVSYDMSDDVCDCICMLSLNYTLVGPPSGSWELLAEGSRLQVDIP